MSEYTITMSVEDHDASCDEDFQPALDVASLPKVKLSLSLLINIIFPAHRLFATESRL